MLGEAERCCHEMRFNQKWNGRRKKLVEGKERGRGKGNGN